MQIFSHESPPSYLGKSLIELHLILDIFSSYPKIFGYYFLPELLLFYFFVNFTNQNATLYFKFGKQFVNLQIGLKYYFVICFLVAVQLKVIFLKFPYHYNSTAYLPTHMYMYVNISIMSYIG